MKKLSLQNCMPVLSAALTLVSAYFLWKKSPAAAALALPANGKLFPEMAMLTAMLFSALQLRGSGKLKNADRVSAVAVLLIGALFLWLHQVFLPVLAAGLYLGYLMLLGDTVRRLLYLKMLNAGRRLLLGAGIQLIITAVFSLAGIGGAAFFRIQVILTAAAVPAVRFIAGRRGKTNKDTFQTVRTFSKDMFRSFRETGSCRGCGELRDRTFLNSLILAVILSALLLQAGRMNIALDYDSLHYGLRSAFVLDNGRGIYENLGSVNDVYVYPKGLETLCLPLSGLASGSFVTAVSWWLTAGTLGLVYTIVNSAVQKTAGRRAGLYAALCIACIPGIMNMAASAKTDAATLFFQLLCVAESVRCFGSLCPEEPSAGRPFAFLKRLLEGGAANALAAAVFTLILKPTGYLFSFLLIVSAGITALAVFLKKRGKEKSRQQNFIPEKENCGEQQKIRDMCRISGNVEETVEQKQELRRSFLLLLVSVLAFVLITMRTVRIAGVPVTTAGTSLWRLFGFELRYPFAGLNAAGAGVQNLLKRLVGVFACPVGEDMSHVYIAWGGLIPALCLVYAAVNKICGRIAQKPENAYLFTSLLTVLIASAVCIARLNQVDGNYFMLLYALAVICAFVPARRIYQFDVSKCEFTAENVTDEKTIARSSIEDRNYVNRNVPEKFPAAMLFPAMLLGLGMCCITNWAGVPGLTQAKLIHKGYVNQIELDRQAQTERGTGELYAFLEAEPTARVLAMAQQPECLVYRCNVQSYTDLEGSGGNVYLVKTLVLFKEFLDYAKEDYILTEDSFLAGHGRAEQIVGYMLEDGSLTCVWEGGGMHLYRYHTGI